MSNVISYARNGAIFDVRFNDAAGGNLISNDEGDALCAELGRVPADVKLVRIRSNGPAFCLGRVSPTPKPGTLMSGHQLKTTVAEPALRVYEAIRAVPVPVVAIVEGAADGYGCALVVACDLAVATENATFRVPEMDRGIPPLLVMTSMMGRVPMKTIAHLALSRTEIDAAAALVAGILSAVVAAADLETYIGVLGDAIVDAPVDSVRAIKEFLRMAPGLPFPSVAALAANLTGTALANRFLGASPKP
jgi:enoyl-CoA hydratase/carnithine racemase